MFTRSQIVNKAREWLNTPFRHQGRSKGVGVDCVGLPLCVLAELGMSELVATVMVHNYPRQPLGRIVHETCQRILIEKPVIKMKPGDILTLRVPTVPVHVAIVSDVGIIHAYSGGPGKVVETSLDEKWRRRIEGCFEIPGVQD